jgi:hypothetical protein
LRAKSNENKDLDRWKKYMQRPSSAVYNSDHRYQRSNGILDNQFKINGLYYTAYLKESNSQKVFKKVRPISAKHEQITASNNLLLGQLDINPIPELREDN